MNLTLQTLPSTVISELLANSKFDGVVLDTEHGTFNNETLYSCIQIITLYKKQCFVRFTDLNKTLVRMCLDAGVTGVIFSTVESLKQGIEIIEFCKYPIHNGKRGCGLVRENQWGNDSIGTNRPLIIGQVETKKAVDDLESIYTCGFDMFIIGTYDLSNSIGCVGDWENKEYVACIDKIYRIISRDKLGIFLPTSKDINKFTRTKRKIVPSLIIWGMDTDFIKEGINYTKYD